MTNNSDKLRSLILAALMVFSVFAGSIALTGSAVAGNSSTASSFTVSPSTAAADENVTHSWTTSTSGVDTSVVADLNGNGDVDEGEVLVTVTDNGDLDSDDSDNDVSVTVPSEDLGVSDAGDYTLYVYEEDSSLDGSDGNSDGTAGDGNNDLPTDGSVAISDLDDSASLTIAEGDPLDSGSSFYSGQDVYVDDLNNSETYRVRTVDDDDEPDALRRTLTADNGVIEFELSDRLSEGDFVIVNENGTELNIVDGAGTVSPPGSGDAGDEAFEVVTQDLTAEFDEDSVGNDGSAADVDYETSSDVRSGYDVNISAQGDLDDEDLASIFGGDNVVMNYSDDDDTVVVEGDTEYTLDFTDVDADTYTFEANVTDTGASDSDDIEVTDTADESAGFEDNVYDNEAGDLVNISVETTSTDEALVQIGEVDESGYGLLVEVEDDNDDGVAYVEFNSYLAGSGSSDVVTAGDDDTSVNSVSQVSGTFDSSDYDAPSNLLDSGDYNLLATAGTASDVDDGNITRSEADSRATMSLNDPSADNLQVWTVPEDTLSDLSSADAEDIPAYAQAGNLTQTDSIAEGDGVVVQIEASGLEGAAEAEDYGDLANYSSENESANGVFSLAFEEDTAPNQGDQYINVSNISSSTVLYDGENDAHYVVFDSTDLTDAADSHEDGDTYTANFTAYEENTDLFDDDTTAEQDVSVDAAEATLDTNADGEIVLGAASGQEATGTTNLAPGTELEVEFDSESNADPFVKRPEATVQSDGSFTAVADFGENNAGTEFTAEVLQTDVPSLDTDEEDGRLVEGSGPVETPNETTDTATATPGTDTATPDTPDTPDEPMDMTDTATETEPGTADGNETGETATGDSGPGFTAALALIALVAAALLAVRRNN